jgi:hypothetical protein
MRSTRLAILAAAAIVAVALFVVLRPDGDDGGDTAAPATTPATTTATTSAAETTAPPATTAPAGREPSGVTVRVVVRNGRPQGGIKRVTVAEGSRVRLVVRSDVSDHVHVHGYDLFRDIGPGAPAQLTFRATIPGQFEVELEDRGLPIAEIEVRPA